MSQAVDNACQPKVVSQQSWAEWYDGLSPQEKRKAAEAFYIQELATYVDSLRPGFRSVAIGVISGVVLCVLAYFFWC